MTDIPGDSSTTAGVTVGGSITDSLDFAGDHDWIAITLVAGQPVVITLNGITLQDPYLYIRDSSGALLFDNDDISIGVNLDSRVAFNPGYCGTYFIAGGAFDDAGTGSYQVSVQPYVAPGPGTIDQIAAQLTTAFWQDGSHHFDVGQGGTITVNIANLNAAEQALARAALTQWADIIGIHFQEVAGDAQILFDNSEDPDGPIAATDAVWANGITSSAHVHISSSWVNQYGSGLYSYSFQTYLHEIGHALGLGHAGDYNGTARYPFDANFSNDAWPLSVMSYFGQSENTTYNYSDAFVVTPMAADIVAMQALYGLSTTTRTGDTVYGYNSNAGPLFDASLNTTTVYAIFDSGGTDTLDFSGSKYNQTINLNAETFSNVNGHINSLYVARGVTIENAIGGTGDDTIIQNAADNVLSGGAGRDTLSYETASAGVRIDLRVSAQQDTAGAGRDTIGGFEDLIGSAFADTLTGASSTVSIHGGDGNDTIISNSSPADYGSVGLYGDAGDDTFIGSPGNDTFIGGDGFDTVNYSNAAGPVLMGFGHDTSAATGQDFLISIERIIGSGFDDMLQLVFAEGQLFGGAGNDQLGGSGFGVSALWGGTGDDTYIVVNAANLAIEYAGEGTDTVQSMVSYSLGANIENLTLTGAQAINAAGNDLANAIVGNDSANMITGGLGADLLRGMGGHDTFKDTAAGLDGDTIADFTGSDRILITDATIGNFSASLAGNTLTYTGGTLVLGQHPAGDLVVSAAAEGGVQITIRSQFDFSALVLNAFGASPSAGGWASQDRYPRFLADSNRDGRADIFGFGENGIWYAEFDRTSTNSGPFLQGGRFGASAGAGGWSSEDRYPRVLGDLDGDGRADIIGFGEAGVYVASGFAGLFSQTRFLLPAFGASTEAGGWSSNTTYPRMVADVNGDGRGDVVAFGENEVYVALAYGFGDLAAPIVASQQFGASVTAGGWWSNDRFPRMLGDVNGDHRADVVAFGQDAVYVAFGQADGTFGPMQVATLEFGAGAGAGGWTSNDLYPRQLADVNGDGRIDIVGFGEAGVYVAYGHGDGTFDRSVLALSAFGAGSNAGGWASQDHFPRFLADVNGDGAADIVGFGDAGVYVALSNGDIFS